MGHAHARACPSDALQSGSRPVGVGPRDGHLIVPPERSNFALSKVK